MKRGLILIMLLLLPLLASCNASCVGDKTSVDGRCVGEEDFFDYTDDDNYKEPFHFTVSGKYVFEEDSFSAEFLILDVQINDYYLYTFDLTGALCDGGLPYRYLGEDNNNEYFYVTPGFGCWTPLYIKHEEYFYEVSDAIELRLFDTVDFLESDYAFFVYKGYRVDVEDIDTVIIYKEDNEGNTFPETAYVLDQREIDELSRYLTTYGFMNLLSPVDRRATNQMSVTTDLNELLIGNRCSFEIIDEDNNISVYSYGYKNIYDHETEYFYPLDQWDVWDLTSICNELHE